MTVIYRELKQLLIDTVSLTLADVPAQMRHSDSVLRVFQDKRPASGKSTTDKNTKDASIVIRKFWPKEHYGFYLDALLELGRDDFRSIQKFSSGTYTEFTHKFPEWMDIDEYKVVGNRLAVIREFGQRLKPGGNRDKAFPA